MKTSGFALLLAILVLLLPASLEAQATDEELLQELNARVVEAYQAGDYTKGLELAKQAYEFAQEAFGPRHPQTLTSLNNLAFLYARQGRYGEAEPLYRQALQARREVLGERHPKTLTSLNNLAVLYQAQV